MDPKRLTSLSHVRTTFATWKAAQEKTSQLEQALDAAVALYAKGQAAFPDALFNQVQEQRREADALCSLANAAFNGIPSRF